MLQLPGILEQVLMAINKQYVPHSTDMSGKHFLEYFLQLGVIRTMQAFAQLKNLSND